MLAMPMLAMIMQVFIGTSAAESWVSQERWLLLSMGVAAILLELWIIVEALSLLRKTPQYIPQKS